MRGTFPRPTWRRARLYRTGRFPRTIETPQQVANQVATNRLLGRPDSYVEEYSTAVARVGLEDVARAARQHLDPDDVAIVVVGDATKVLDLVRPFAADVRVIDDEGRPGYMARLAATSALRFDASGLRPLTLTYGLRL